MKEANNAHDVQKTMLMDRLVVKQKEKYGYQSTLSDLKNEMERRGENNKIYKEIITERRRYLMSFYVQRG